MKIETAIEILEESLKTHDSTRHQDFKDAQTQGIEALKQITWLHESQVLHDDELLPRETKN